MFLQICYFPLSRPLCKELSSQSVVASLSVLEKSVLLLRFLFSSLGPKWGGSSASIAVGPFNRQAIEKATHCSLSFGVFPSRWLLTSLSSNRGSRSELILARLVVEVFFCFASYEVTASSCTHRRRPDIGVDVIGFCVGALPIYVIGMGELLCVILHLVYGFGTTHHT